MEQKKNESTLKKQHTLEITSRNSGSLTGIEKVVSSCDTALVLVTSEGGLSIAGTGLKINRFNVDEGTLSFAGTVNSIKYSAAKVPMLKRIFK